MATGTVEKVITEHRFGFITTEAGEEHFFHRADPVRLSE